jgi:hypothetical protein
VTGRHLQGADDQVVNIRGVLERDHVLALPSRKAQRRDRGGRIGQEPGAELRIDPSLGDNLCAVARADLGLVGLNEGVDSRRIDVALLGQDLRAG